MTSVLKQIAPSDVASLASDPVDPAALQDATLIVNDVRVHGIAALQEHAVRLGDVPDATAPLLVSSLELQQAFETLPEAQQHVLQRTAGRIKLFAATQRASIKNFEQAIEGGVAGQDVRSVVVWVF